MKSAFFVLSVLAGLTAVAEKQPYERYQSIVDRQMFGVPPKGFDPMKLPSEVSKSPSQKELTKEQEKLQSSIHFSVINVAADGTPVVGFSDNSDPKIPVHHYLKVGEESGGWKVVSADPSESTMTIEKDGVELSLKLGDNSGKSGKGGAAVPAVAAARGDRRSPLLGSQSLRSRRMLRREKQEAAEAERKQQEEERRRREQEERVQREADREEQRQQLRALQESLSQLRAERQAEKSGDGNGEGADADNNAQ